jgi:ubiquinone/menaquinone biosynthesis C-methylase UbiE
MPMRKRLFKWYWRLERAITPGLRSSQDTYARLVKAHVTPGTRWLDIGCGHQFWPEWIPGQEETARRAALCVGLDPDFDSIRQHAAIRRRVVGLDLPFADGTFTLVTANMVFEHLEAPLEVLRDIRRVLTPGGVCIFHTTNAAYWQTVVSGWVPQPLKNLLVRLSEGRVAADVYPTHYRINTEAAVRRIVQDAGFDARDVIMLNTSNAGRILLLGPLVVLELLWLRLTQQARLRRHRTNIIGVLSPSPEPSQIERPHASRSGALV